MVYIPNSWLKNVENEAEVRLLLDSDTCLRFDSDKDESGIIKRLEELGEPKILQEYKKRTFGF